MVVYRILLFAPLTQHMPHSTAHIPVTAENFMEPPDIPFCFVFDPDQRSSSSPDIKSSPAVLPTKMQGDDNTLNMHFHCSVSLNVSHYNS